MGKRERHRDNYSVDKMSRFDFLDQETIEGQILYLIDRVSKGAKLHAKLTEEVYKTKTRLRNMIIVYREHRTEPEMDDLIAAIIKEDALFPEDIQFVFDLNPTRWNECIHRIRTERK